MSEQEDVKTLASELVNKLLARGMTPPEIADAMDNRVSARTIYRWSKGESGPQQTSGIEILKALVGVTPEPLPPEPEAHQAEAEQAEPEPA